MSTPAERQDIKTRGIPPYKADGVDALVPVTAPANDASFSSKRMAAAVTFWLPKRAINEEGRS